MDDGEAEGLETETEERVMELDDIGLDELADCTELECALAVDTRLDIDAVADGVADDALLELNDERIDDELEIEITTLDEPLRVKLERTMLELMDILDDGREDVGAALDEGRPFETELEIEADREDDLELDTETERLIVEL